MSDDKHRQLVCVAERVLAADPARVWALVANPERIGEWAGLAMVGYMGTELPKTGQSVFVRSTRWRRLAKVRRVEVEAWDAGARVSCLVHTDGSAAAARFELAIHPEVARDAIATTVRLVQRVNVPVVAHVLARWWVEMELNRKLDKIAQAVQP